MTKPRNDADVEAGRRLMDRMAAYRAEQRRRREARAAQYAEQLAKHIEHPQSRGARRRMLSKP
jgi:hypothetical protein